MNRTKTVSILLLLAALIAVYLPVSVSASRFYSKDRYIVSARDTIQDDIYLASGESVFDGVVTGDLLIACKDYKISGEVWGSVNSMSQTATIRGKVGNTARIFAQTIDIYGEIGGSLLTFGQDIEISEDCRIGKDATIFGSEVTLNGDIGRDLELECNVATISGKIDGDVIIKANRISIVSPAEIAGDIIYKSKKEIRIEDDVIIGGEVEWDEIEEDTGGKYDDEIGWVLRILLFFASLITGLFIIGLAGRHSRVSADHIIEKPLVSLSVGFVAFCVMPFAIAILAVLIISIPVAIILLFAYTIFFYVAKIYVAIAIGRIGIRAFRKDAEPKQGWSLLFGLIVLTIMFMIPVLGWLVYFAVIFWGIGGILMGIRSCRWAGVNDTAETGASPPPVE